MQLLHQLLRGVYTLKHSLNCVPPGWQLRSPAAWARLCVCVCLCWGSPTSASPFRATLVLQGGQEGATALHQLHSSLVVCDPFTAERLCAETALNDSLHLFTEPLVFVISFSFFKNPEEIIDKPDAIHLKGKCIYPPG